TPRPPDLVTGDLQETSPALPWSTCTDCPVLSLRRDCPSAGIRTLPSGRLHGRLPTSGVGQYYLSRIRQHTYILRASSRQVDSPAWRRTRRRSSPKLALQS